VTDEINADVGIVSHAPCAGALSCWITNSQEISRIRKKCIWTLPCVTEAYVCWSGASYDY